jgi:hypothetical protein
VCDDPTCFEEPAELDIVTPTPDIVLWQDTTSEPELPGVTPVDNEKPVPVVEEKGGDGGCTATGRSTATPGLLLLALFCALAVLRYRWVW